MKVLKKTVIKITGTLFIWIILSLLVTLIQYFSSGEHLSFLTLLGYAFLGWGLFAIGTALIILLFILACYIFDV